MGVPVTNITSSDEAAPASLNDPDSASRVTVLDRCWIAEHLAKFAPRTARARLQRKRATRRIDGIAS